MESVDGIAVENACSFSDSRVGLDHTQLSRSTASFNDRGFARIECLITDGEVAELIESYMQLVDSTTEEVAKHRYDLGEGDTSPKKVAMEKITQIMWPSDILPALRDHAVRSRGLALARALHCDDSFVFDFDMLIAKAPHTDTPTPAHQDQAYWPLLKDKRAVSIWVALDESTIDNGCMWYGPGTHKLPLRPHRKSGPTPNAALECDASEAEMEPMPLKPGWAGAHAGGTLHYSRGNSTDGWRRAYIMNFRPAAALEEERALGFDHGRAGHKSHDVRSQAESKDRAPVASGAGAPSGDSSLAHATASASPL